MIKEYNSKEELELELFQELPDLQLPELTDEQRAEKNRQTEVVQNIFGWRTQFVKVLQQVENRYIFSDGNTFILSDGIHQVGETGLAEVGNNYDNNYCKIEGTIDWSRLSELTQHSRSFDLENYKILNQEIINAEVIKIEKIQKDLELQQELNASQEKIQVDDANTIFKSTGNYTDNDKDITIIGKTITLNSSSPRTEIFELSEDANTIFNVSDFDTRRGYMSLNDKVKQTLIAGGKNFCYTDSDKKQIILNFDKKPTLNGVVVNRAKINFILKRLRGDELENKELIGKYSRLSGMKADIIDLKEINIYRRNTGTDIKIPVQVGLTQFDDTLRITAFGTEKELSWAQIKEIFFDGGSTRSVRARCSVELVFKTIAPLLDLNKQSVLDYLKKAVMIQSLGQSEDEN